MAPGAETRASASKPQLNRIASPSEKSGGFFISETTVKRGKNREEDHATKTGLYREGTPRGEAGGGSNAVFIAVGAGFTNPQDARVTAFRTRAQKLQTKLSQMDAASAEAAVAAVTW